MTLSLDLHLNPNFATTSPGDMQKAVFLIWEMIQVRGSLWSCLAFALSDCFLMLVALLHLSCFFFFNFNIFS